MLNWKLKLLKAGRRYNSSGSWLYQQTIGAFSKEKRAEKWKQLQAESSESYFKKYIDASAFNGKLFCSLDYLLPPSEPKNFMQFQNGPSLTLPFVLANTSLLGAKSPLNGTMFVNANNDLVDLQHEISCGKITLLTISYNYLAQSHVDSFVNPILSCFGESRDDFQCYEIRVVDKALSWTLTPFIKINSIFLPKTRRPYIINYAGSVFSTYLRSIGILNTSLGIIMLLDRQGTIRWLACGSPSPNELHFLSGNIDKLLKNKYA